MNASNQETKTRYSDEELEEFRILVEGKLKKARQQFEFTLSQVEDMADNPDAKVKALDDGTSTAELEQLNAMAVRQQKHIQHLENALIRIQNKVFGICRVTGKLIAKERLRAVPHATLSIEAKHSRSGQLN